MPALNRLIFNAEQVRNAHLPQEPVVVIPHATAVTTVIPNAQLLTEAHAQRASP